MAYVRCREAELEMQQWRQVWKKAAVNGGPVAEYGDVEQPGTLTGFALKHLAELQDRMSAIGNSSFSGLGLLEKPHGLCCQQSPC